MSRTRSLAAAQTIPAPGDLDANLDQHRELARVASAEGARIVVFPELSLTGYELELASELALSEDDPRLEPLVETARSSAIALIVGAPVRIGPRLHLGAFVLSPDRTVQLYTKRRLGAFPDDVGGGGPVPPPESTVFEPGDREPLVEIGGERAAVAICAEAGRASHVTRVEGRGARAYLASSFVIPSDLEDDTARLRRCAELQSTPVVFSNFGGPSGGLPAAGRSAIWSGAGDLLARLEGSGKGVAVAVDRPDGWDAAAIMLDG